MGDYNNGIVSYGFHPRTLHSDILLTSGNKVYTFPVSAVPVTAEEMPTFVRPSANYANISCVAPLLCIFITSCYANVYIQAVWC